MIFATKHGATGWVVLIMILLSVSTIMAQETSNKAPGKPELQRMYMDFLAKEGYKPEIDSDGDVQFKHEGRTYFILVNETDLEFFCMIFPGFWPIESEKERLQILAAADVSNANSKVSKVHIVKDNVWVTVELFVAKPEDFKAVFHRAMSALQNGTAVFVNKMRE